MKCPLLKHRRQQELGLELEFFGDCISTDCGFWSHACNQCSMTALAEELHWISDRLQSLSQKIETRVVL